MSTSTSTPALSRTSIVRRLRAAGCVFAEDEAQLLLDSAKTPAALLAMVERRVAGLPLEHVVGWVDFCGLRIAVDPGVFVPRRRTELLVRRAAALAATGATIVDLACGSGAVGVAIAALVNGVALYAVDIEPAAVRCARRNLAALGGHVHAGDLYEPLPVRLRGHVDVLVANVPYVPTEAVGLLPREARIHEPLAALDGGSDGLAVLRRVAAAARDWLARDGRRRPLLSARSLPTTVELRLRKLLLFPRRVRAGGQGLAGFEQCLEAGQEIPTAEQLNGRHHAAVRLAMGLFGTYVYDGTQRSWYRVSQAPMS